jgi:hypothetical protein
MELISRFFTPPSPSFFLFGPQGTGNLPLSTHISQKNFIQPGMRLFFLTFFIRWFVFLFDIFPPLFYRRVSQSLDKVAYHMW